MTAFCAEPLIDFRDVTVMRGQTLALDHLSLTIGARENVAIIGPNGSGKSTLLKTITRELYPIANDETWTRVLGREHWDVSEMRHHMGVIINDLFAKSTRNPKGKELVLSGFFSSFGLWRHHQVSPEMEARADEVITMLRARHLVAKPFSAMSSGERKRMTIARALVHGPQALILDEPSDSLDLTGLKSLQQTMRTLAQSGISIVLVTHRLEEIIPEISRVILLKNGKIFRDGPKAHILTRENLSALFEADIEPMEHNGFYQCW